MKRIHVYVCPACFKIQERPTGPGTLAYVSFCGKLQKQVKLHKLGYL